MPSRRQMRHLGPRSRAISGHLPWGSCPPAAKSRSGKDAGSVRSWRLRARLRTRPDRALQRPGGCETRGRGPPSNTPPLLRPHAVVGLRGDVLDAEDLEAGRLERADCRLAPGARSLDEDLDLLEAVLHALAGTCVGGHLGGERRRLARALEAGRAG